MVRSLISQFSFLPSRPKEALTKIGKNLPCSFQEEVKNVICPTDNDGWRPITYGLLGNSGDLKINDICFGIQNLKWHDRCNWEFVFFGCRVSIYLLLSMLLQFAIFDLFIVIKKSLTKSRWKTPLV